MASRLSLYREAEKSLLAELKKIQDLIAEEEGDIVLSNAVVSPRAVVVGVVEQSTTAKSSHSKALKPKGDMSWEKYIQIVLEEMGGAAKTVEVAEYAIHANPDIDKDTVSNAVSGKLSKLYRGHIIDSTPGAYKKEGYTYRLKKAESPRITLFN